MVNKKHQIFFFFPEEIPQGLRLLAGHTLPEWGCSNVCQVPSSCFISRARRANARAISADRKTKMKKKKHKKTKNMARC